MKLVNIDVDIDVPIEVVEDLYNFLTGDKPHAQLLMQILNKKTADANSDLMVMASGEDTLGYIIRDQQRKGTADALQHLLNLPEELRQALKQVESS